jgi:Mg2+ and Co2+ transporter CorA
LAVYDNFTLIIFQILTIGSNKSENYNDREQVSMLIFRDTIITLQEGLEGDCWQELRQSVNNSRSKIRGNNCTKLIQHFLPFSS